MPPPGKQAALVAALILSTAFAALLIWREAIFGAAASVEGIEAMMGGASWLAAAISTGLMVLHSFVPLPAELIAIANGMVFGFGLGLAITWIGAMLGAVLAYGIGWKLGRPAATALSSEAAVARVEDKLRIYGWVALFAARLLPIISFNLVNYAAGALRVRPWMFLWTTAIGILPVCALSVLAGSHMIRLPWYVSGLILLGIALLAAAMKAIHRRRSAAVQVGGRSGARIE
jgi:uncharacterized membrane protein YdjX (TVP38/TMEM64 family)